MELIDELRARMAAEEARWKTLSEQIQRQYDMERAAHLGRLGLLREMLESVEQEEPSGNGAVSEGVLAMG